MSRYRNHSAKPIEIDGIHYATRKEAAKALGLSQSGLSKRISRHGPNKLNRTRNAQFNTMYPIKIDNQTFDKNIDLANYLNLDDSTLGRRINILIKQGLPITKTNIEQFNNYRLTEIIHGKVYHHWKDISDDFNISMSMLHKRQGMGLHGDQLVTPIKSRSVPKPVTIKGVTYDNLKDAAKALHIPYQNLRYRYKAYQSGQIHTEDEMLQTKHIGSHRYYAVINNQQYTKLKDITNDYPASYNQIKLWHKELRQGVIDQATFEKWVIAGKKLTK